MISKILEVFWYLELTAGTLLVGLGVYQTGKGRKRRGWRMVIAGVLMITLYAVFAPDIIVEMYW